MHDKTDKIFVKSIIDIAHALNIRAVAEFVENDEILQTVRGLGADYGQGFALGKPFVFAPRFPKSANSDGEQADIQIKAG
jgi:EAL domain-containing protein (putative c-di-GMP-specific phosphodiesterase class I)